MKKILALFGALAYALTAVAGSTATDVTLLQDEASGTFEIRYALNGDTPAIVTLDVETNGVSVGGAALACVAGDVNCVVTPGQGRRAWWTPRQAKGLVVADGSLKPVLHVWSLTSPPPYLAIDLTVTNAFRYYAEASFVPGGVTNVLYKTKSLLMRRIPAAGVTWTQGINETSGANPNYVQYDRSFLTYLSEDFYLGVYELTRGQFACVKEGASAESPTHPLAGLAAASELANIKTADNVALSVLQTGGSKKTYAGIPELRLPSNSQWEFACRAGSPYRFHWGNDSADAARYAVFGDATEEVGLREPNAFGLYDMHGNVAEWTSGTYLTPAERVATFGTGYVAGTTVVTNPVDGTSGINVPLRGGKAADKGSYWSQAATQNYYQKGGKPNPPFSGVRLCLPVSAVR